MYQLICMSRKGEHRTERHAFKPENDFNTYQEAMDHSDDLFGKWYIWPLFVSTYPFHFVVKGNKVVDNNNQGEGFGFLNGRNIEEVQKIIQEEYKDY